MQGGVDHFARLFESIQSPEQVAKVEAKCQILSTSFDGGLVVGDGTLVEMRLDQCLAHLSNQNVIFRILLQCLLVYFDCSFRLAMEKEGKQRDICSILADLIELALHLENVHVSIAQH